MDKQFEVSRIVDAEPGRIFALLRSPQGHVSIDSTGMLQSAEGEPVAAAGDTFVVHMDREALGDRPMGKYDVEVIITGFEQDRWLEWTIVGTVRPPLDHRYGYRLAPDAAGTRVTSYYDWSRVRTEASALGIQFPIIPEANLRATLGILARTIEQAG